MYFNQIFLPKQLKLVNTSKQKVHEIVFALKIRKANIRLVFSLTDLIYLSSIRIEKRELLHLSDQARPMYK